MSDPDPQAPAPPPAIAPAPQSLAALPDWAQVQTSYGRKALLIGLGSYTHIEPLPTPPYDIPLMSAALTRLSFDRVQTLAGTAVDVCELRTAIDQFVSSLTDGDLALIYFSGHGVARNGFNYLVPSTGRPVDGQMAGYEYVSLDYIQRAVQASPAGLSLIFLDACRTDPFAGQNILTETNDDDDPAAPMAGCRRTTASIAMPVSDVASTASQAAAAADPPAPTAASTPLVAPSPATPAGLSATIPASTGLAGVRSIPATVFIGFASEAGQPAETLLPGEKDDQGSLYTRALSQALQPKCSLGWIMDQTRAKLSTLGAPQSPWFSGNTGGTVMIVEDDAFQASETEAWIETIRRSQIGVAAMRTQQQQEISELTSFLFHYPIGHFSVTARKRLQQLRTAPAPLPSANPVEVSIARLYSGTASSPSAFSSITPEGTLETNGAQQLFSTKSKNKSGKILSLGPGLRLSIKKHFPGNWALVETQSGVSGYLPGVELHRVAGRTITLDFASDDLEAGFSDIEAIRKIAADALTAGDAIVIRVGAAGGTDSGLAARTAYVRSLRLSREIETVGLASDRITLISGAASDTPVNKAVVTLVRL